MSRKQFILAILSPLLAFFGQKRVKKADDFIIKSLHPFNPVDFSKFKWVFEPITLSPLVYVNSNSRMFKFKIGELNNGG